MIIIVGASASGKTVIAKYLIEKYGFKKFITTTTRKPRQGEENDVDYHFVSDEVFNEKIQNNEFVEHVSYSDKKYGSEKREIDDNKILIVEPKGLTSYLRLHNKSIVTFYLKCNKEVRFNRMIERNDDVEEINKRIEHDDEIFTLEVSKKVNYIIDSSTDSVQNLSEQIYKLYLNHNK